MRSVVLADTGPLYAAVDPDDQYHARAQQELKRLEQEGLTVEVAYSTITECYTLVQRRLGLNVAHRWLREILDAATLVNPTSDDYLAAAVRVQAYADQPLTLFDVVLAIVSKRLSVPVWTYDYHFDIMQATVWR